MTSRKLSTRRVAKLVALAAIPAFALSACSSSGGGREVASGGTGAQIAKVTIGIQSPPRSLDIAHAADYPSNRVISAVFDRVLTLSKDGKVKPWIAESWTNPDPLTYVFKIRSGVKFWDGTPLTTEDVAYSLRRHLDPKLGSEVAYTFAAVKTVTATDANTVTVKLSSPSPGFLFHATDYWTVIKKEYSLAAGEDLGTPKKPGMGTGPYEITKYSTSDGATMTRFAGYWGTKPTVKILAMKSIADPEAARLALLAGDIQGYFDVPLLATRKFDRLENVNMTYADGTYIDLMSMNVKRAPFDDPKVREAVAHLVDRKGLNKPLFGGHATLATSILPRGQLEARLGAAGATELVDQLTKVPSFDAAAASEALKASTHPDGFTVTLDVDVSQPWMMTFAQSLAENAKPLGIVIKPKSVSSAVWADGLSAEDRGPLQLVSLGSSTPDITDLPPALLGNGSINISELSSPELIAQLGTLTSELNPARMPSVIKPVLEAPAASLAYMPLFEEQAALALSKDLVWQEGYSSWALGQMWPLSIRAAK